MRRTRMLVGLVAVAAVAVLALPVVRRHRRPAVAGPVTRPVAVAATGPTTRPRRRPATYASYLDAVRSANPAVAATEPLGVPVEFADAAHVVLRDAVYVDPPGNLWVTRADGHPTADLLAHAPDGPEYVVRDRPVFVHWGQADGNWVASVVVRAPGGGYDLVTPLARRHLAGDRPYRWAAAYSVPSLDEFVVPTDVGASVFDVTPTPAEHYLPLPGCAPGRTSPPVTLLDNRGILAWAPWDNGRPGSAGVSRFVDGNWAPLPPDWPARPILLSMLLDGSVLRVASGGPPAAAVAAGDSLDVDPVTTAPTTAPAAGTAAPAADGPTDQVTLSIGQPDAANVDEPRVAALVAQLSDPDPDQRRAAFEELSRYGPALVPVLDRARPDQPPAAQVRIARLMRNKATLGGMSLIEDRLTVAKRQADGTTILFAPAGVRIPTEQADETVTPAWLVVRPDGRVDRPLLPSLVNDQDPDHCTLRGVGDEWLVLDAAGPRRFFGNALVPLLTTPAEHRFTDFVAIAARHRWVFRDPATGDTLVMDPTIADPTPRLPVWSIRVARGTVGWDDRDDPAVQSGGLEGLGGAAGSAGRSFLDADQWQPLLPTDELHTDATPPDPDPPPATRPATAPSTAPSDGPELLRTGDGTRYYDGRQRLVSVDKAGRRTAWPLPPTAVAAADAQPVLMRTDDGLLFLYNGPGRLIRLRPTPAAADPFELEATFTDGIPNADHPARVWLDPNGRIDFATDGHVLTITFPSGRMPKAIADMIPAERR